MNQVGIGAGLLALAVVGAVLASCESSPPPARPTEARPASEAAPLDVFSGARAWSDLIALTGAEAQGGDPRAVLRAALEPLGLEVREVETGGGEPEGPPPLRHLIADLPGHSSDLFALVAPYDGGGEPGSPPLAGNVGASGAALLLELARVLSTRANPYTLRFVFLAGEQSARVGDGRWRGSLALAERMREQGDLEHTRLLVAFDAVCGPDLRIVRDLNSHRVYREEFFKAARRVRHTQAFAVDQPFEQAQASHVAFLAQGLRASVALVGTRAVASGSDERPPGCVPESIESVGVVALEALETIGARLAKIDRFARSPLSDLAPEALIPDESTTLPADRAGGRAEDGLGASYGDSQ